jgi:hypothetical protein
MDCLAEFNPHMFFLTWGLKDSNSLLCIHLHVFGKERKIKNKKTILARDKASTFYYKCWEAN